MRKVRQSGQSMGEYAIIVALIAVVSIAGLMALGGQINIELSNAMPEQTELTQLNAKPAPVSVAAVPATGAKAPAAAAPAGGAAPAAPLAAVPAMETNNALVFSQTTSNMVETAGANGTTTLMANQISLIAKQLLAEGKIDQAQAGYLNELANKGHRIAAFEKMIETESASFSGSSAFLGGNSNITFEGKKFKDTTEVLNMIGYGDGGKSYGAGNVTVDFESAYDKVVSSGALGDPAAKSVVQKLVADISKLSDEVQMAGWAIDHGEIKPAQLTSHVASAYPNTTASTTTNVKSAKICTTGKGADSGTNCK